MGSTAAMVIDQTIQEWGNGLGMRITAPLAKAARGHGHWSHWHRSLLMVAASKQWVPERRDMIWIHFKPQVGTEMRDEHPMLVLSSKAFNERTGVVIGLPMTHASSNEKNPFAIRYMGPKSEVGYVLTHQPKSFDWRQRQARPHHWKQLSTAVFEEACEGLNSIISLGG